MAVIKRLAGYLGPYWKTLIFTCTLLVLNIAFSLLGPLFQRQIIDQVIGHQALGNLLILVAGLIAVYAIAGLTEFGDQYLRHTLGERFICDLRVRLYGRLAAALAVVLRAHLDRRADVARDQRRQRAGAVRHARRGADCVDGLRLLGSAVVLLVPRLAPGVGGLRARADRRVSGCAATTGAPGPSTARVRRRLGDINAKLQDNLAGIRVVQAFGQETSRADIASAQSASNTTGSASASSAAWSTFFPALHFVSSVGGAAGARRRRRGWWCSGQMTLGTLVAFLSYSPLSTSHCAG